MCEIINQQNWSLPYRVFDQLSVLYEQSIQATEVADICIYFCMKIVNKPIASENMASFFDSAVYSYLSYKLYRFHIMSDKQLSKN